MNIVDETHRLVLESVPETAQVMVRQALDTLDSGNVAELRAALGLVLGALAGSSMTVEGLTRELEAERLKVASCQAYIREHTIIGPKGRKAP